MNAKKDNITILKLGRCNHYFSMRQHQFVIAQFMAILFTTIMSHIALGQNRLYFEKDGIFRYGEQDISKKKKSDEIEFIIERDSNSVFLIATSQAANYSLPGIGIKPKILLIDSDLVTNEEGKKKSKGKNKNKDNDLTSTDATWKIKVDNGSKHLFYRIYRFPKELVYDEIQEMIGYNSLLFELNRKASVIVGRKRAALKNQLDALTFKEFIALNKNYEDYKQSTNDLKELENNLVLFLNSKDSLSINDKIQYQALLTEKNLYLKEIERNEEFISTDNALDYLKTVREKYLNIIGELAQYEAKKLTYRNTKERALKNEIASLSYHISSLGENLILRNFLKAEKFLDNTYNYSLDIVYEGHVTIDPSTKEIEYNHHHNGMLNTSQLERQTPVLPQLTNRNYLSVVVHNVPGALMTKEGNMPFQLSLEYDSSKKEYDWNMAHHLRGLNTKKIDGQQGSLIKSVYTDISQCEGFEKDVSSMKISEIVASAMIDKANTQGKDSCLLNFEKKLTSTVEARDILYESIKGYGGDKVKNSPQPLFRDYIMSGGKRFKSGAIPSVVINTAVNQNTSNNKISVRRVTLVRDSLESVQRLRRFGISTGLVMKSMPYYSQKTENIPGTSFNKLVEKKFTDTSIQPTIFFSIYLKEQNLDKPAKRAGSINLGIDYADGNLLDNFYFGYGIEPMRHFQVIIGASIGRVDKVDMDSFDQLSSTFETKNEMAIGTFISANFYLSAIPKIISSSIKK